MGKAEFPDKKKSFFTPGLSARVVSVIRESLGRIEILKKNSGLMG